MIVWLRDGMIVCFSFLLSIRHDKRYVCMKISRTQIPLLLSTLELFCIRLKWFASQPRVPAHWHTHTDQITLKHTTHTLFVLKGDQEQEQFVFALRMLDGMKTKKYLEENAKIHVHIISINNEMFCTSYNMSLFIYLFPVYQGWICFLTTAKKRAI